MFSSCLSCLGWTKGPDNGDEAEREIHRDQQPDQLVGADIPRAHPYDTERINALARHFEQLSRDFQQRQRRMLRDDDDKSPAPATVDEDHERQPLLDHAKSDSTRCRLPTSNKPISPDNGVRDARSHKYSSSPESASSTDPESDEGPEYRGPPPTFSNPKSKATLSQQLERFWSNDAESEFAGLRTMSARGRDQGVVGGVAHGGDGWRVTTASVAPKDDIERPVRTVRAAAYEDDDLL